MKVCCCSRRSSLSTAETMNSRSTPASAAPAASASPCSAWNVRPAGNWSALAAFRSRCRTWIPRSSSPAATCDPTCPVTPVTAIALMEPFHHSRGHAWNRYAVFESVIGRTWSGDVKAHCAGEQPFGSGRGCGGHAQERLQLLPVADDGAAHLGVAACGFGGGHLVRQVSAEPAFTRAEGAFLTVPAHPQAGGLVPGPYARMDLQTVTGVNTWPDGPEVGRQGLPGTQHLDALIVPVLPDFLGNRRIYLRKLAEIDVVRRTRLHPALRPGRHHRTQHHVQDNLRATGPHPSGCFGTGALDSRDLTPFQAIAAGSCGVLRFSGSAASCPDPARSRGLTTRATRAPRATRRLRDSQLREADLLVPISLI